MILLLLVIAFVFLLFYFIIPRFLLGHVVKYVVDCTEEFVESSPRAIGESIGSDAYSCKTISNSGSVTDGKEHSDAGSPSFSEQSLNWDGYRLDNQTYTSIYNTKKDVEPRKKKAKKKLTNKKLTNKKTTKKVKRKSK